MRTAKSWAEEWSGTTVSSPEDVERFIRAVQKDALIWGVCSHPGEVYQTAIARINRIWDKIRELESGK